MKEQWDDNTDSGVRSQYDIDHSQNSTEPMLDPEFSLNSADVNLKYKKFFPFIGAYLIYKFLWKI